MAEETVSPESRSAGRKGLYRKLIVFGVIVLLLLGMWAFDAVRAQTFHLELVDCTPETAVASGQDGVEMTYRLTRRGKPVEGHHIFVYCDGNGRFYSCLLYTSDAADE